MPGRILIADDSPTIRRLVRGILASRGYEVLEAGTGEEGQAVIDREGGALGLAILDLQMPRGGGLEILVRVRANEASALAPTSPLPVVILTADEGEADHAWEAGANGFLTKPFDLALLLQTVRELLR